MTKYTRKDIIDKAGELAKMLAETEEVDFFKRAESQINANEKVQNLIRRIKLLQKESVNLQHYQKHEAYQENEKKIDALMDELDNIPIVKEFKQSQSDVNAMLQTITLTISNRVTKEIIGPSGTDQRSVPDINIKNMDNR
ncbi:RicAFT regulatory complex protein RicA family protein [Camelliibacillus cellulosilyticus]|uniref:RicAFT regulatory complex protein RicA family protein n=1 Tax=Camelliibacillus cellulosilyticus TaxID=2174486 RepID=A0ABV9GL83_9BACL